MQAELNSFNLQTKQTLMLSCPGNNHFWAELMKFLTLSPLLKSKDILSGLGSASTPKLHHYWKSQFR